MTGSGVIELAAADRLRIAAETGVPCTPIRDILGPTDIDAAYRVQRHNLNLRYARGARRVGRKIGLTSPAVQQQLGVSQPDSGSLLADMAVVDGAVPPGRLLQPRGEAEIAFWLTTDIPADIDSIEQVATAIGDAAAAIEIVDSRVTDWDIAIVDTVADNASCGMFIVSDHRVPLADVDLLGAGMEMTRNGELVSTGTGANCLGHPLNAVLWLAKAAADLGDPLRAGELILSGALGPLVPVAPGDVLRAEISGLGPVHLQFLREE